MKKPDDSNATLDTQTDRSSGRHGVAPSSGSVTDPGFVIVWAADAPALVGAWLPLPHGNRAMTLGRADDSDVAQTPTTAKDRVTPVRQRPGLNEPGPDLVDPFLSRDQLRIAAGSGGDVIEVENIGKRDLLNSRGEVVVGKISVALGDVIEVRGRLLLLATARPRTMPSLQNVAKDPPHVFGEADAHGFVGETETAWRLRDSAAFVGGRTAHVLLLGESGTGKEIVARTIHQRSNSKSSRLVSRNAATLPAGLIDAELFGHVANYPNVGMRERPGLIGDADGGTLFLDEIGELPHDLSTKLLRVLDEGGEYQRLGDTRTRSSKFRLIGATNRPIASLKTDVAARFRLRISVPPLSDRREDIPLLARHLLRRAAAEDPAIGERFFEGWDPKNPEAGEPRLSIELVRAVVLHNYTTHIRELDVLLWASLSTSAGNVAELGADVETALNEEGGPPSQRPQVDVRTLTEEDVRSAIEKAGGVHDKAWRDLGLANRHVLKRLVKKFGLRA